ncbi:MAG: hypothetical protein P8J45_04230 [Phycisphaerales bacterium]|nr:hypothetical protein [Phycisphaerales bacterium]
MSSGRGISPESSTEEPERSGPKGRIIALCRHEQAGALPHYDLLLGPEETGFGDDEPVLESWRLARDLRELQPGAMMMIESIGLHRGLYARLEAPRELSQGRGSVSPVASGRALVSSMDGEIRELRIAWSDGTQETFELKTASDGACQLGRPADRA